MVKSRIFDNRQLLKEHPEIPHYKEEVVCFMSEYKDRSYPENERYFNRELYMILVLEGRSEILLNGEFIVIEPDMLLVHGIISPTIFIRVRILSLSPSPFPSPCGQMTLILPR